MLTMNYRKLFFFFILIGISYCSSSQTIVADSAVAYHNAVIGATFKRIARMHYNPRPMDSVYSRRVWEDFIRMLDPEKDIFLQRDIQRLEAYKNNLGDELNDASSVFFDTVYACYRKRIGEVSGMCARLLKKPFDMHIRESVETNRKKRPYPANAAERENTWRKMLKYAVLKHYMDGDSVLSKAAKQNNTMDTALERRSYDYVRKWYADYFRNAVRDGSMDDKFALYVSYAVGEIDPHTAYIAPTDRTFNEAITKRFFGIGIELGIKDVDFYVKKLMRGGTAYKSGEVKENDLIMAIADSKGNMQQVSGMTPNQVANMIRGEKGTSVALQLEQRGQAARTVILKRDEVLEEQNRAKSAIIEKDGKKFGYIYLPIFYTDPKGKNMTGASNDVAREVMKLQENEVDGIVMDLRDNGGGALDEVVKMCGTFLPGGAVTWLKAKDSLRRYGFPDHGPVYYDGPMTVLVDESSASASEIFTAAMQDYRRAVIIGTSSTFGKGTAQSTMSMGKMGNPSKGIPDTSYGSLRLTEQKFYRVTGISTQLAGVKPDIILQDRMSLESQMEKDYPSALSVDTLQLPQFDRLSMNYNYQKIVQDEKERLLHNASFISITKEMQEIKSFDERPAALDLMTFRKEYEHRKSIEDSLKQARSLSVAKQLNVQPAAFRRIKPGTIKEDPADAKEYNDWLQKLSRDIYLNETINVLADMAGNPAN